MVRFGTIAPMTTGPRTAHPCRAMRAWPAAACAAAVCCLSAVSVGGCGWDPYRSLPSSTGADDPAPSAAAQALSPRTLVISPLTSIRRSETAEDQLVVHLAILDGFNQPVKALGTVMIELTRPVRHADDGSPIGGEDATTRWEIDLRDPEVNAAAFDGFVTKTYALRLGGLPGGETAPTGGWATVKATFTVVDGGWGDSRVLTAEARVAW